MRKGEERREENREEKIREKNEAQRKRRREEEEFRLVSIARLDGHHCGSLQGQLVDESADLSTMYISSPKSPSLMMVSPARTLRIVMTC